MEAQLPPIKAYKLKELAALYSVERKTMRKWISKNENIIGKASYNFHLLASSRIRYLIERNRQ